MIWQKIITCESNNNELINENNVKKSKVYNKDEDGQDLFDDKLLVNKTQNSLKSYENKLINLHSLDSNALVTNHLKSNEIKKEI